MAAGKFNMQKASGGVASITVVDGATNTNLVLPESGTVATTTEVSSAVAPKANTADLKEIGVGQTWQDLTASRVSGTTYTNSTGKPILIKLVSTSTNIALTVGGVLISASTNAINSEVIAIVPSGSTYIATLTITKWLELR